MRLARQVEGERRIRFSLETPKKKMGGRQRFANLRFGSKLKIKRGGNTKS